MCMRQTTGSCAGQPPSRRQWRCLPQNPLGSCARCVGRQAPSPHIFVYFDANIPSLHAARIIEGFCDWCPPDGACHVSMTSSPQNPPTLLQCDASKARFCLPLLLFQSFTFPWAGRGGRLASVPVGGQDCSIQGMVSSGANNMCGHGCTQVMIASINSLCIATFSG